MKTLDFYIIKRITGSFALGVTVLLMVLLLERSLRLIQIVTEQKASGLKVFEFLFYLLPHYLGLAVPAALFLAILLAVRRLEEDSELPILQSAGLSLRYLYRPIFILIIPITIFMMGITTIAQPESRYAYRVNIHNLSINNPLAGLQAGTFFNMNDQTVIYADRIQQEDGLLEGVFISETKLKTAEQITISAQQAKLSVNAQTGQPILQLINGTLIQDDKNKNKVSKLSFESYPWSIKSLNGEPYGPRGQDEREMRQSELLEGGVRGVPSDATKFKMTAEFHKRFVQALSLICLALWAVPLALIGSGRMGKASGIIIGGALLVFYEKVIGLGEAYVARGEIQALYALWLPLFILGLGGILFMIFKIPQRLRIKQKENTA